MQDRKKWTELGFGEKLKLSLASFLIISSVVLGYISFIILLEIPSSVIGLCGLFGSEGLAILGIASYYNNELIKFESKINSRLEDINENNTKS